MSSGMHLFFTSSLQEGKKMSANFNQRQSNIASTPGNRDIFGVGVPQPGVPVGHGQRARIGPSVGSVSWNAGPGGVKVMPNIGFDPSGLPRGAKKTREFMSNTFVQQQFFVNRWRNNSQLSIIEGQLVFVHRSVPKKIKLSDALKRRLESSMSMPGFNRFTELDFGSYTIINLSHLNALLSRAWANYNMLADQWSADGGNSKAQIEAHTLRELLSKYSEDLINAYCRMKRDPLFAERFHWIDDEGGIGDEELEKIYQLSLTNNFRFVICPQMILDEYTFLGSIQNLSRGTSMEGINNPGRRDDVLIANVIMTKKTEMHNIFQPATEVDCGSKLFLMYTRKRLAEGRAGAFTIVPLACKYNSFPTFGHRQYRDQSGELCTGLVRGLGYVQLPGNRVPNSARQAVASGVRPSGSFEQPKRATAILPKIQIQLDMNV